MIRPRYVRAVNSMRPYGAHRYDLFGPKLGRRLTLFGRFTLNLWIHLESDPAVLAYCERPLFIPDAKPARLVDFWVRRRDEERMCVLLRPCESTAAGAGDNLFPAFEKWSRASSMQLELIHPQHLDDAPVLRDNRMTMLQQIATTTSLPVGALIPCVLALLDHGLTLAEIERRLAPVDPMLVRAAVFRVVLRGEAMCSGMALEPLGPHTFLERP
ncbi:hypothetical protein [Paraburkholderia strydomiana]|uniref:hypothetical protein n=1 Tax=Paraburkholderia strydomiana TaxID=1245417 RepID=UPI001BE75E82|nr:hypothetical protein [Paraburkholderia strydomiana]MBT2792885.1 hypothetical protein [Paraburkholderia strydomiana]